MVHARVKLVKQASSVPGRRMAKRLDSSCRRHKGTFSHQELDDQASGNGILVLVVQDGSEAVADCPVSLRPAFGTHERRLKNEWPTLAYYCLR